LFLTTPIPVHHPKEKDYYCTTSPRPPPLISLDKKQKL